MFEIKLDITETLHIFEENYPYSLCNLVEVQKACPLSVCKKYNSLLKLSGLDSHTTRIFVAILQNLGVSVCSQCVANLYFKEFPKLNMGLKKGKKY